MTHAARITLLKKLVSPETLADSKLWGRELCMLKDLITRYPDTAFWTDWMLPDRYVRTLLQFKGAEAANELERSWRMYQADIERKALDIGIRAERVENEAVSVAESGQAAAPSLKPKRSVISWIDM